MRLPLRHWRFALLAVAVVGALAMLAAACGDGGEPAGSPAASPGGPTKTGAPTGEGFLTGMVEDVTTTNFWSYIGPDATVYTGYVLAPTASSLYAWSEQRWDWVPHLAVDLPSDLVQEGDFWVTTVTLYENAVWSDGQPITAEDAVFTWGTVKDLNITDGNWPTNVPLDFFDHAEAVDATTLKIFFSQKPGVAKWQFGLGLAPILPKHYWEPVVTEAKASADPIATLYAHDASDSPGDFDSIAEREAGAFVAAEANANFLHRGHVVREYANGAYQHQGGGADFTLYGEATGEISLEFEVGPFVDSVVYNVYADQDSTLLAMQEGEFDYWLSPLSLPKGLADQLAGTEGITTISNPSNGFRYLGFNFRKPPLNDLAYRKAVALLVDKEFLCNRILLGQCNPDYAFVPEGNAFWNNPDVPKLGEGLSREERINEALAAMKAAGYTWDVEPKWDPDGNAVNPHGSGLKKDGQPVPTMRLSAPSAGYDPLRSTFAIWIGEWLNEFGIPIDVQLFGFNVLAGKIFDEQDVDIWMLGWGLTPFPDHMSAFFRSSAGELGGFNAGGYSSAGFDALADDLDAAATVDEAKQVAFQQQEFLANDLAYVVLFDTPIVEAYREAKVTFPYTEEVDGLQGVHLGLPYAVAVQE